MLADCATVDGRMVDRAANCTRCKTRTECRTIVSMKTSSLGAAAAAIFALGLGDIALAQSQEASDVKATVAADAKTVGQAVEHSAQTVGHAVADKSRQAEHVVADDAKAAAETVRDDSKKAAQAVENGAKTVGQTAKENAVKAKEAVTPKSSEPVSKN